jgi:hypothetical protein
MMAKSDQKPYSPEDISLTRAVTKLKTAGLAVFSLFRGILGVLMFREVIYLLLRITL